MTATWYWTTDPLTTALCACLVLTLSCWVVSVMTGDYSQVDRLWSILPVLYVVHFAAHARFADARLVVMTALAVLWGVRLTWNFARKGGYRAGGEDYRWLAVRRWLGPVGFQALNATFIAPFQNLLLLLLAAPACVAAQSPRTPLGFLDAVTTAAFLAFWIGEAIADQQQWRFQSDKQACRRRGEPAEAGFLTTGLFRWSRHPNFFCELGMWWSFYGFAVAASGALVSRWLAGPVLLTLLFQGSTWLTERLSAEKYPAYRDYQRRTSRLVPLPPSRGRATRARCPRAGAHVREARPRDIGNGR
jgi:steroid 5-alpha reductase family enzyme